MASAEETVPFGLTLGFVDQGSQYSSSHGRSALKANNLVASMSRAGNCPLIHRCALMEWPDYSGVCAPLVLDSSAGRVAALKKAR
ncbi:hypothetical protein GIW45_04915 [Pseudomonas congelans]|nr:hypothetical protein [Pseudomonas congelans]